jgi:dienelactone hydrolase
MSVYATNVGRPQLGTETPADRGLSYVDVSFATSDGVTLSGWYIPSANRAAVVLLHGASSTRTAVLDHAVLLVRHGYGVLLYDARGMGRSGGRAMAFGWYGDLDISAALGYLQTRPEVDSNRIGAVGESMGGEQAIGAMATDTRLRAVVAEGATNRVADDWSWLSDEYGVRGRVQQGIHWLTYKLTDQLTDANPPITLREAVTIARRPVLLIAAGNIADEGYAARNIQAAAPDAVEVWVVPGASHTGGLDAQPGDWEQRVTTFLATNLET